MPTDITAINRRQFVHRFGLEVKKMAAESGEPTDTYQPETQAQESNISTETNPKKLSAELARHVGRLLALPKQAYGLPTMVGAKVLADLINLKPGELFSKGEPEHKVVPDSKRATQLSQTVADLGGPFPGARYQLVEGEFTGSCNGEVVSIGSDKNTLNPHIRAFTVAHENSHLRHRDSLTSAANGLLLELLDKDDPIYETWHRDARIHCQQIEFRADREGYDDAVAAGFDGPTIVGWLGNSPGNNVTPSGYRRRENLINHQASQGEPFEKSEVEMLTNFTKSVYQNGIGPDETFESFCESYVSPAERYRLFEAERKKKLEQERAQETG